MATVKKLKIKIAVTLICLSFCVTFSSCSSSSKPSKSDYTKAMVAFASNAVPFEEQRKYASEIGECMADKTYGSVASSTAKYLIADLKSDPDQFDGQEAQEEARLETQSDQEEKDFAKDIQEIFSAFSVCSDEIIEN